MSPNIVYSSKMMKVFSGGEISQSNILSPFMQNEYLHSRPFKYEPNPCGVFSILLLETKKLTVTEMNTFFFFN